MQDERAERENTERNLQHQLSEKEEEMARLHDAHENEMSEKAAMLDAVQAKVDALNGKLALQEDALAQHAPVADSAANAPDSPPSAFTRCCNR